MICVSVLDGSNLSTPFTLLSIRQFVMHTNLQSFQIGTGVTNALIKARKAVDKELDDEVEDIPVLTTSVAYGVYMAVSSNLR